MPLQTASARRMSRYSRLEKQEEADAPQEVAATTQVRRGRLQMRLALACAIGVFVGVKISHRPRPMAPILTEQTLAGTWELQSVNADPVGPNVDSVVLSQSLTFQGGRLHGETRLRANSEAATLAMPFPDESVTSVVSSADGHDVTVTWDGTYALLPNDRLELTVGKAGYKAGVALNPKAQTLTFDHDVILTYKGKTLYHAAPNR